MSTPRANRRRTTLIALVVSLTGALLMCYLFIPELFPRRSAFDVPDKENVKIVAMFDRQLERRIKDHEQNVFHPGYLPTAQAHVAAYLKTIRKIESYSRYGISSPAARNGILVRVTFANGRTVKDLYTGRTSSHMLPPPLLMAVTLQEGKTQKVLTNGVEKNGSPDWVINDLNVLIDAAISYDKQRQPDSYFPPARTRADYEKEWAEQ